MARTMAGTKLLGEALAAGAAAAFVCDAMDLACVAANPAACALTGYTLGELRELRLPQILQPAGQLVDAAHYATAGSISSGNGILRKREGESVEVRYMSETTDLEPEGEFVLTLCWPLPGERSATARRRAEP
jgi:PAS domain-containing protein